VPICQRARNGSQGGYKVRRSGDVWAALNGLEAVWQCGCAWIYYRNQRVVCALERDRFG